MNEERCGLLQDDELKVDDDNPMTTVPSPSGTDRRFWLPSRTWLLSLLLVICMTDFAGFIYVYRLFQTHYADPVVPDHLPFANPYINLDGLYHSGRINSSKIEPFINKPRISAQVFSDRPDELSPKGRGIVLDRYGTLSTNERRLWVDATTHTILQFRTIDFGMEKCSLAIRIPYSDGELEGGARFSLGEGSKLDIYALDEPKSINVQRLSWASRPPRRERVATVEPKSGEEITVSWFACPWSSLNTFEIACADGQTVDCMVDVWTSQNKTWGAFMYQHQTV